MNAVSISAYAFSACSRRAEKCLMAAAGTPRYSRTVLLPPGSIAERGAARNPRRAICRSSSAVYCSESATVMWNSGGESIVSQRVLPVFGSV